MDEGMLAIMEFLSTLPPEERIESVKAAFEDSKRLNKLQALTEKENYTGRVIMRLSGTGRGWRLHETDQEGASDDVREALDKFFAEFDPEGEVLGVR
jgi:hypothetical protein